MKKLWSGIKSLIDFNDSKLNPIINLKMWNGNVITDPFSVANTFNDFFVNIGNHTERSIPKSNVPFSNFLKDNFSHLFFITSVSTVEVSSIILSLNQSKSVGPNSIPIRLLKILNSEISNPLAMIINESFSSRIFPDKLKIAKGSRSDKNNYRAISVLSVFSKIFEKLMHKRLFNYLERLRILHELQFGFRETFSTSHALISLIEHLKKSLDEGEFGCGIFIDLRKAFDTVGK